MTRPSDTASPRRNLFVFHLESVAWQAVHAFPEAFPHLTALMADARSYRRHFSAATSTQMVIAAFLHANDFEMDAAPGLAAPAGNNPSLFSALAEAGYATDFLCVTARPGKPMLRAFAGSLPPAWCTNDFRAALERFEGAVAGPLPFAVYAWSLVPHIETDLALSAHATSLDDLVAGSCAVADTLLGAMIEILRRRGALETTTVLVYGDHGDDHGTHGFKAGMLHGVEPFTALVHTPLVIRDPALPSGWDDRLVSTVDLAPTCLDLLGLPSDMMRFPHSGRSLAGTPLRAVAFAQNFTANQADDAKRGVLKSFAAIDHAHALLVSSAGLALYNYRLDPGNQTNLLHHFDLAADGGLRLIEPPAPLHAHFGTVRHLWRSGAGPDGPFHTLRAALATHVTAKNDYAFQRETRPGVRLGEDAFMRIDRRGRTRFFGVAADPEGRHSGTDANRAGLRRWIPRPLRKRGLLRS